LQSLEMRMIKKKQCPTIKPQNIDRNWIFDWIIPYTVNKKYLEIQPTRLNVEKELVTLPEHTSSPRILLVLAGIVLFILSSYLSSCLCFRGVMYVSISAYKRCLGSLCSHLWYRGFMFYSAICIHLRILDDVSDV
jgi:hypothetical protein